MTVDRLPLSVSVITFNEERNLGRCLESVRELASEIVIIDSGSTDRTAAIAREYGANFLHADWPGFVAQKAKSLEHCSQPWLLCLDADEAISPELAVSIRESLGRDSQSVAGYWLNRRTLVPRRVDLARLVSGMAAPPRAPGLRRVVRRQSPWPARGDGRDSPSGRRSSALPLSRPRRSPAAHAPIREDFLRGVRGPRSTVSLAAAAPFPVVRLPQAPRPQAGISRWLARMDDLRDPRDRRLRQIRVSVRTRANQAVNFQETSPDLSCPRRTGEN